MLGKKGDNKRQIRTQPPTARPTLPLWPPVCVLKPAKLRVEKYLEEKHIKLLVNGISTSVVVASDIQFCCKFDCEMQVFYHRT